MAQHSLRPARSVENSDAAKPGELKISDLSQGQGLTDRYDNLIKTLCLPAAHEIDSTTGSLTAADRSTRFCRHIRYALNADTAYLCNRTSLTTVATSSSISAQQECEDTTELHAALTSMVCDLWNCTAPLCPPDINVFTEEPNFSYCVIPLYTEHDHLLVVVNSEVDKTLIGDYIADALTSVYKVFLNANNNSTVETTLEPSVLDALHRKYQLSSPTITNRRHELFCNQVKQSVAEFDGLTLVNIKDKPEPLRTVLPTPLYEVAALWDKTKGTNAPARFKATLDNHCLVESAHGYKTLCDNENLAKFSDGRSLKIRVHAETLSDYSFTETLRDLIEKAVIHSSKLEFTVVSVPGKDFTAALHSLYSQFDITVSTPEAANSPIVSIADEFDVMQLHGVKKPGVVKKINS